MIASIGSSITALNAFAKKMAVTADNIANVNTDGFKKSRAMLSQGPQKDVRVNITQADTPGPPNPDAAHYPDLEPELSNVDLTEELPQLMTAQRSYEAVLKAIRSQDEMIGAVLDILR